MRMVTLLDTSVASDNLGDEIIMDSVRDIMRDCMPDAYFYTVTTHDGIGRTGRRILDKTEFGIVGGTNILSSHLVRGANWRISPFDFGHLQNVVLMGVGWRDYHPRANAYARFVYDKVLSRRFIHSYRDQHTFDQAAQFDRRGLNTACPTMWKLSPAHCAALPTTQARTVITALTYYRPDPVNDRAILDMLQKRYDRVLFWIQQAEDLAYLRSLGDYPFELIAPDTATYTATLDGGDVDYVGSRLHGGIRALQRGRRALILAVDNRATEIGRDTGLPVRTRSEHEAIAAWISGSSPLRLDLPVAAIDAWTAQFSSSADRPALRLAPVDVGAIERTSSVELA